ncbi:bifunctional aspartate kinase/homoserine dehydrogenase I [Dokdonella sp.]|uniref:bifunctional aspartate kinase/homoserine dehydrogenase I n=1 Tax=Dokdonella sp. TaxID=2291710 RepID=UPI0025B879B3|nr:bifunctional aspartate kinase/homoserine dehydrogenase I [Dokdonella sp.]MBX3691818.1 bifunctional aspartate kinase/homoserine dehydrogenase I [Dokdonella sp.]MCW5568340.1 bifunctional aspartate kinase/homoserine dehydrogenase I [Dokdonella sp.]
MSPLAKLSATLASARNPDADAPPTIAHKFGGSSLADAGRYRHVGKLLLARDDQHQVSVVSAMQGVTDALIGLASAAARREDWRTPWQALRARHVQTAEALLGDAASAFVAWLDAQFNALADVLNALAVLGIPAREAVESVQGLGEVFSANLLRTHLHALGGDCAVLDAREVLVVAHGELGVAVDWEASAARLADWRRAHDARRIVVTGFVARTADGRATILGRNGSDFSGAIFAALFDARELHIWTDVDGVLSADPRLVPEAVALDGLSYEEACELAYFGAKVIHPQTMLPAMALGLPIHIRNTFRPDHPGTRIASQGGADAGPVRGLSLANDLALVNVEGAGMIGVPGTAERVFAALRDARVSVVMISQGSSEHSICCVVRATDAERAEVALDAVFARELALGQIQAITVTPGISVLAAVGDGMAGTPGVSAQLFGTLGRARVNIRAIAQGASERNISVALDSRDAARALRAVHAGFWLSAQTISVGIIGPGNVGRELIEQLREALPRLRRDAHLDLRVRAIASTRRLWTSELGELPDDWAERLAASETPADLDTFTAQVHATHLPHAVIVDCSASDAVAARYAGWLAAGIHVITPNKQAGAGPLARWQDIRRACAQSGARWRYEATVGAGLPVIQTLRDLIDTGDELLAVEGIFSGTLAWLFNRYDGREPFSKLVREALALGYTEPDPRDDLSGLDVARKLVILAREAGLALELADVDVRGLVPPALLALDRDAALAALESLDADLAAQHAAAHAKGCVLRYVARLDRDGTARVSLVELPATHAFAHLSLTDNIVQYTTRRYADNPLIVRGPGAGREVTAAGVFADLLRVGAGLGAKL